MLPYVARIFEKSSKLQPEYADTHMLGAASYWLAARKKKRFVRAYAAFSSETMRKKDDDAYVALAELRKTVTAERALKQIPFALKWIQKQPEFEKALEGGQALLNEQLQKWAKQDKNMAWVWAMNRAGPVFLDLQKKKSTEGEEKEVEVIRGLMAAYEDIHPKAKESLSTHPNRPKDVDTVMQHQLNVATHGRILGIETACFMDGDKLALRDLNEKCNKELWKELQTKGLSETQSQAVAVF